MTAQRSNQGLTIIELLISIVLLGLLAAAILAPLTGLFQMTTQSTQTLNTTTYAQEVMEFVQGQWRTYPSPRDPANPTAQDERNSVALTGSDTQTGSRGRYDQTCLDWGDLPRRNGLNIGMSVWQLDGDANQGASLSWAWCNPTRTVANPPPMKRVTVTITPDSGDAVSLTTDIPRP